MKSKSNKRALEVVLRAGKPAAVILDINEYRDLLERVEQAEDLKMLRQLRSRPLRFRKLEEFIKEHRPGV